MKPHYRIAIILLWRDNKILSTQRRHDAEHLPDIWEFPGGKCEPNETPERAAIREAREELGVEIEIAQARDILEFDYPARGVTLHPFDARIIGGEPQPLHAAALRWLLPSELRDEDFPPANAPLLEKLRQM
jgi:8-oxo-dGTP diphosphatase